MLTVYILKGGEKLCSTLIGYYVSMSVKQKCSPVLCLSCVEYDAVCSMLFICSNELLVISLESMVFF